MLADHSAYKSHPLVVEVVMCSFCQKLYSQVIVTEKKLLIQTHTKTLASAQNRFLTFECKSVTKKKSVQHIWFAKHQAFYHFDLI